MRSLEKSCVASNADFPSQIIYFLVYSLREVIMCASIAWDNIRNIKCSVCALIIITMRMKNLFDVQLNIARNSIHSEIIRSNYNRYANNFIYITQVIFQLKSTVRWSRLIYGFNLDDISTHDAISLRVVTLRVFTSRSIGTNKAARDLLFGDFSR